MKDTRIKKGFLSTCEKGVKANRWKLSLFNANLVIDNYNSIRNYCISNNIEHYVVL